jgi:hypothetical protein
VRNHIPKRVPGGQILRNHSIILIIFSLIDFKKRLSKRDTDKRFHLPTAKDDMKISTKSSMRLVGTARYGHINSFGKSEHGSTLVFSRISCIASSLALLKDEQKLKLGGCVGAHKTPISCANVSSKWIK